MCLSLKLISGFTLSICIQELKHKLFFSPETSLTDFIWGDSKVLSLLLFAHSPLLPVCMFSVGIFSHNADQCFSGWGVWGHGCGHDFTHASQKAHDRNQSRKQGLRLQCPCEGLWRAVLLLKKWAFCYDCCSVAELCPTPGSPWMIAHQAALSFTISWSLINSCPLTWWCHNQMTEITVVIWIVNVNIIWALALCWQKYLVKQQNVLDIWILIYEFIIYIFPKDKF